MSTGPNSTESNINKNVMQNGQLMADSTSNSSHVPPRPRVNTAPIAFHNPTQLNPSTQRVASPLYRRASGICYSISAKMPAPVSTIRTNSSGLNVATQIQRQYPQIASSSACLRTSGMDPRYTNPSYTSAVACKTSTESRHSSHAWPPTLIKNVFTHRRISSDDVGVQALRTTAALPVSNTQLNAATTQSAVASPSAYSARTQPTTPLFRLSTNVALPQSASNSSLARTSTACTTVRSGDANACMNQSPSSIQPRRQRISSFQPNNVSPTDVQVASHAPSFVLPKSFIQEAVDLVPEEPSEDPVSESPSQQQNATGGPETQDPSGSHSTVPPPLVGKTTTDTPSGQLPPSRGAPSRQHTQPSLGSATVRSSSIGRFAYPIRLSPHRAPVPSLAKVDIDRALPRTHSAGRFAHTLFVTRDPQSVGRSDDAQRPQNSARGSSFGSQTGSRFAPPTRSVQSARDSQSGMQRRPSGTNPAYPMQTKSPRKGDPTSSAAVPKATATADEAAPQSNIAAAVPFVTPQSRLFAHARLSNKVPDAHVARGPVKAFASPTIARKSSQTLTAAARPVTAVSVHARVRGDSPAKAATTAEKKLVRPGSKRPHDDAPSPPQTVLSANSASSRRTPGTVITPSPSSVEPSYAASTVASKCRSEEVRRGAKRMTARQGFCASSGHDVPKPQVGDAKQRVAPREVVPCSDATHTPSVDKDQTAATRPATLAPTLALKTDRRVKTKSAHAVDQRQRQHQSEQQQQRQHLQQRQQLQQREQQQRQQHKQQNAPDAIRFAPVLSGRSLTMRRMTLTNMAVRGVIPTAAGPKNALVRRSGSTVTVSRRRTETEDGVKMAPQSSASGASPQRESSPHLSMNQASNGPPQHSAVPTVHVTPPRDTACLPHSLSNPSSADSSSASVDRTPTTTPFNSFEPLAPLDVMLTTILSQNLPSPAPGSPASQGALSVLSSPLVPASSPGVSAPDTSFVAPLGDNDLEVTMPKAMPTPPMKPTEVELDAALKTSVTEENNVSHAALGEQETSGQVSSPAGEMDSAVRRVLLSKPLMGEETQLDNENLEQSTETSLTTQVDGEKNVETLSPCEDAEKYTQVSPAIASSLIPTSVPICPMTPGTSGVDCRSQSGSAKVESPGDKLSLWYETFEEEPLFAAPVVLEESPEEELAVDAFLKEEPPPDESRDKECDRGVDAKQLDSAVHDVEVDNTAECGAEKQNVPGNEEHFSVEVAWDKPREEVERHDHEENEEVSEENEKHEEVSEENEKREEVSEENEKREEVSEENEKHEEVSEENEKHEEVSEENEKHEEVSEESKEHKEVSEESKEHKEVSEENEEHEEVSEDSKEHEEVSEENEEHAEVTENEENEEAPEEIVENEEAPEEIVENEEAPEEIVENEEAPEEIVEKQEEESEGVDECASSVSSNSESAGDVSPSELAPLAIDPAVWAFMESRYKTTGLWAISKSHPSASSEEIQVLTDILDQEWETHSTWKSDPEELETNVRYSLRNGGEQVCVVIGDLFCQGMSKFVTLKREGMAVTIFWPCSLRLQRMIKR